MAKEKRKLTWEEKISRKIEYLAFISCNREKFDIKNEIMNMIVKVVDIKIREGLKAGLAKLKKADEQNKNN